MGRKRITTFFAFFLCKLIEKVLLKRAGVEEPLHLHHLRWHLAMPDCLKSGLLLKGLMLKRKHLPTMMPLPPQMKQSLLKQARVTNQKRKKTKKTKKMRELDETFWFSFLQSAWYLLSLPSSSFSSSESSSLFLRVRVREDLCLWVGVGLLWWAFACLWERLREVDSDPSSSSWVCCAAGCSSSSTSMRLSSIASPDSPPREEEEVDSAESTRKNKHKPEDESTDEMTKSLQRTKPLENCFLFSRRAAAAWASAFAFLRSTAWRISRFFFSVATISEAILSAFSAAAEAARGTSLASWVGMKRISDASTENLSVQSVSSNSCGAGFTLLITTVEPFPNTQTKTEHSKDGARVKHHRKEWNR